MGIDTEKYRKMSVEGRWLAIALEIVRDNPGLTRSEIIAIAAPFMPPFIMSNRGRKMGKVQLATRATNHATFKQFTTCVEGRLFAKPKREKRGPSIEIVEYAKNNEVVCRSDFPHIKNFCKLADQQVGRGFLTKVSSGVYSVNKEFGVP